MNTATITVYDLDKLQTKVDSMNKKAAKAGVSPITWTLLQTVMVKKSKTNVWGEVKSYEVFDNHQVEIVAEEIVLPGGYRLVGVIDHVENLVRSVPGETMLLSPFVDRGPVCDHCHTSRDRNETFILQDVNGTNRQVGRQCLGLFLGITPETALNMVGMVSEAMVFDEEWTGSPRAKGVDLSFFLAHTACMIRTAGWRSRSSAGNGQVATADMALSNMLDQELRTKSKRTGQPLWVDPSVVDGETATAVAAWMAGLAERSNLSDYMTNLAQIGQNGFATDKSAGYAASGINAFLKEKEEAIKVAARREQSGVHVGVVGGKLVNWEVEKVSSAGFDTEYGYTFFHRFVDKSGNVLVWRTTTELDNGKYLLSGTVKAHDEFKGEKQTNMTRCKTKLV